GRGERRVDRDDVVVERARDLERALTALEPRRARRPAHVAPIELDVDPLVVAAYDPCDSAVRVPSRIEAAFEPRRRAAERNAPARARRDRLAVERPTKTRPFPVERRRKRGL